MQLSFHLGLHKTASTWFQATYFKNHPEIAFLNNYQTPWNDELIRYLIENDSRSFNRHQYKKMVSDRIEKNKLTQHKGIYLISAERLSGHPYSGGYDREKIANNIYNAYPNAKVFLLVRNQVDLINSMYKQIVKGGYIGTIKDLLNTDCWKGACFNLEYYNYFNLYKLYSEIFREKNLRFFLFEEFVENHKIVLKQLCLFLNISEFSSNITNNKRINITKSNKEIWAIRQLNHLKRSEYNKYANIDLGHSIFYKILLYLLKLYSYAKDIELDKKDAATIKEYFALTNQEFFGKVNLNKHYIKKY